MRPEVPGFWPPTQELFEGEAIFKEKSGALTAQGFFWYYFLVWVTVALKQIKRIILEGWTSFLDIQ